jgi:hypothetical protein
MGDVWNFGGIFFQASMLTHSCIPNASQSENIEEGCLEVAALVDIPPGMPVTICYDSALKVCNNVVAILNLRSLRQTT